MKRILLLSDTHGFIDDAILRHAREADEIWHAGDIGAEAVCTELEALAVFRAVYGNIDGGMLRKRFPEKLRFNCEGLDVSMIHIGGYPGHYAPGIRKWLYADPPGLFICGHSHILRVMRDNEKGFLTMNPGAAGVHGFHKMRTMIRFKVSNGNILEPEVIELGQRGRQVEKPYLA